MPGLGLGCSQRCDLDQEIEFLCLLCQQVIGSDESRIPLDRQIAALDSRTDFYDPCLACGQRVPFADSKSYKARVNAEVRELKKHKAAKERRTKEMEETKEWPPDTKSLVGAGWAGWCPIDGAEMYANLQDYYECPSCRLQIHAISGGPNIMPLKGMGQFRLRGGDRISAVDELPGSGGWPIKHDGRV